MVEAARNCTGTAIVPARVVLQADATCLDEAAALFGCPVEIGARGVLQLDAPTAARRLLSANPGILDLLDQTGPGEAAGDPQGCC